MKSSMKNLLLFSSVLLFMLPESANALPGFSRQTGQDCMSCHVQNMQKLNNHGRNFALSGYTLYNAKSETQSLVEGSEIALGLPATLNVSAVLKARYVQTTQKLNTGNTDIIGTQRGELQVFETSGLYFGGRMAENVGGLVSLTGDPSKENDVLFGGKVVLAYEALNGYTGVSLYSTQNNGIFSGMENFNTGLNAPLKQFENSHGTNAAQATGIGNGPATGLQLYYGDDNLFASVGASVPAQNNEGIDAGKSLIPFARVAYTLPLNDWSFMIGAFGLYGDAKASNQSLNGGLINTGATLVNIHKEGYGFDFEMTGKVDNVMMMATISYVIDNRVDIKPINLLTSPSMQQTGNKAKSVEFQMNPVSPNFGLKFAYLNYINENTQAIAGGFIKDYDYNAFSLGFNYLLRQNITFDAECTYNRPQNGLVDNYYDVYLTAILAF